MIFFSLIDALMLVAPTEPPANAIVLATNAMAIAALSFRMEQAYGRGRDANQAAPVTCEPCRRYVCQNYIYMSPEGREETGRPHMTAGASAATRRLQVTPLTGTIGAELSSVDLASDLDDATIADIRAALLKHRAVFFRDQDLDYEQQVAFASRFGNLTLGHPTIKSPEDKPLME